MKEQPWQQRRRRSAEAARELRARATTAEEVLWGALRGRRLAGLKFRRQHPVGWLVLDFCCPDLKLAIEVDGGVHDRLVADDARRTVTLEEAGYHVIRFRNEHVLTDLDAVLRQIEETARALARS